MQQHKKEEQKDDIEIATTTQKGQITIPKDIREKTDVKRGTRFAVYGEDDTIILKKLSVPGIEEFEKLSKWGREHAKEQDIEREDVLAND